MRFSLFLLVSLAAAPVFAVPARVEGTLSQVQGGQTVRAKLWFETLPAPAGARMRLEIERDEAAGIDAQIIIADGNQTRSWQPSTKRLRRLNFNIAQKWWRGWGLTSGGAANFVLAGASPTTITEDEGAFSRRDAVLFGGGGGDSYYAAFKSPARRFPREIVVSADSRIEKSDANRELARASIVLEGELPVSALVVAAGATTRFDYALKARAEPFDEALWTLPAEDALVEDEPILAPADYAGANTPDARFNLALARFRGAEDVPGALLLLESTLQSAPRATAPAIALFEIALGSRDLARAQNALNALKPQISVAEYQARAARLALSRRDFAGAAAALDAALGAEPRHPVLRWRRSLVAQLSGDIERARALWRELLVDERAPLALRVGVAEAFATSVAPGEFAILRDTLPRETEPILLARALLSLRAGEVILPDLRAPLTRASWALGLEKANRDDDARVIWESFVDAPATIPASTNDHSSDALRALAHSHLMTLGARRGDVAASLNAFRAWSALLSGESEEQNARLVLFEAWQKNFKRDALARALENRASATASNEFDARLFHAYQVAYGNAEGVARATELGAARFPNGAFWNSKRAEILTTRGLGQSAALDSGAIARDTFFARAFEAIDRAIQAEPNQPFWRFQKSLIAAQRSAKLGMTDAGRAVRERNAARAETETLLKALPGDPDVLVSAAISGRAFDGTSGSARAIERVRAALETAPLDGDRHTLVFAARQTLASSLEKTDAAGANTQWQTLLAGAQSAGEQANLAGAYFGFLERQNDAARASLLLSRLAGEGWEFESARAMFDAATRRALASKLLPEIVRILREDASPQSQIAAANLAAARLERAQLVLQNPAAPASADADLVRATRELTASIPLLISIAQSEDRVLGARAAVFLAERAALSPEESLKWLRRARELEPGDASLRLALAGALQNSPDTREEAARERRFIAQGLPFDANIARLLSLEMARAGEGKNAEVLAEEAFQIAAHSPNMTTNDFQKQAFTRARLAWAGDNSARAVELYSGLALEQWANLDRAAALLAWRSRLQESGREAEIAPLNERIRALQLDLNDLEQAAAFVDAAEN